MSEMNATIQLLGSELEPWVKAFVRVDEACALNYVDVLFICVADNHIRILRVADRAFILDGAPGIMEQVSRAWRGWLESSELATYAALFEKCYHAEAAER